MRFVILAAIAALPATAMALPAAAAEPQVTVDFGRDLQDKIEEYGPRDVNRLAEDLKDSVLREAAKSPALDDAVINLVLEDAVPNRPTMRQMSDKPGLSYESHGIGGATITGTVTLADGTVRPVSFRWYESDIRWSWGSSTWSDAEQTFDRFARRLARGESLASR